MKSRKGFTLIELLVVIAIAVIALIGSVVVGIVVYNHMNSDPVVSIEEQKEVWLEAEQAKAAAYNRNWRRIVDEQQQEYEEASEADKPIIRQKHIELYDLHKEFMRASREEAILKYKLKFGETFPEL